MELKIGAHMPITGGLYMSAERAKELGFSVFQIFTRNPRGWKYPALRPEEVKAFKGSVDRAFYSVNSHMPYLPNLASPKDETYRLSVDSLKEELRRADALGLNYVVVHVGSHLGAGIEEGKKRVAAAVSEALASVDCKCSVLLENMAGQKNSVGSRLEDIGDIIEAVKDERVGVCFDTCHAYAAGYDISTSAGVDEVLEKLDRLVGLKRVRLVHLNDSKARLGSGLDRHERIGRGFLGKSGIKAIVSSRLAELPMVLETPVNDYKEYAEEAKAVISIALEK